MAKEVKTEYKYGVAWLAKKLDLQPASVRLALRKLEIDTTKEGVYGWNDLAKAEKIREQIAKAGERAPAAAKKSPAKKSAKKKKAVKKSAKKSSGDGED